MASETHLQLPLFQEAFLADCNLSRPDYRLPAPKERTYHSRGRSYKQPQEEFIIKRVLLPPTTEQNSLTLQPHKHSQRTGRETGKNRCSQVADDARPGTAILEKRRNTREKAPPPPELSAPGSHPWTSVQERRRKSAPATSGGRDGSLRRPGERANTCGLRSTCGFGSGWPPSCAYVEKIPTKRDKNNCWSARSRALRSTICAEPREPRGEPLPLFTRDGNDQNPLQLEEKGLLKIWDFRQQPHNLRVWLK